MESGFSPRKSDYIELKKEEIKIENTNAFSSKAYGECREVNTHLY